MWPADPSEPADPPVDRPVPADPSVPVDLLVPADPPVPAVPSEEPANLLFELVAEPLPGSGRGGDRRRNRW